MSPPSTPERPGAEHGVPPDADVTALRDAAPGCRGCELWADATQVVFSAGDRGARLVLVGEQPGDPEAGIDRAEVYVGGRPPRVPVTAHPSSVPRLRGKDRWVESSGRLVADLREADAALEVVLG